MAKKKTEQPIQSSGNLISDLISGTEFKYIGDNEKGVSVIGAGSLSDKPYVETPLYVLNDLFGGGLPLGSIVEIYGPNAAGKSSMMYETLGNFQKKFSDGVAFIIDSESSTDNTRLQQLGVDTSKAPRMGAATLESGFEQISAILKKMNSNDAYKDFPVFIIWDKLKLCPIKTV